MLARYSAVATPEVRTSVWFTVTPIPASLTTYSAGVRLELLVARVKRIPFSRMKSKKSVRPGRGVSPR